MRIWLLLLLSLLLPAQEASRPAAPAAAPNSPVYTADGRMVFPARYREWVFLSSGIDMTYGPGAGMADHHMFDNVFVNPEAYQAFLKTGTWPDKTVFVLEVRGAESKGSINSAGHYQGSEVMGMEVHVKDEARFPGKWAFFGFRDATTGGLFPPDAACYSCHRDHGAVDTTFVQFYPTLLEVAKQKGTLTPAYEKETAEEKEKK
ncbi:MAG TPA: cytochrome P460 family protein [Terriglobales bacterium]|nr:cytochrome P460 family protein [Terriglobales bacterium]